MKLNFCTMMAGQVIKNFFFFEKGIMKLSSDGDCVYRCRGNMNKNSITF
jgi:hypothetical protein